MVNRALAIYGSFMDEYEEQRHSDQANKVVLGRIEEGADPQPVELMADTERGRYGVRSPPEGGPTAVE